MPAAALGERKEGGRVVEREEGDREGTGGERGSREGGREGNVAGGGREGGREEEREEGIGGQTHTDTHKHTGMNA